MALKPISGKDIKRSKSFKDLSMSFSRNRFTDDVSSVTNENSIKQAIKNLILTVPGEKPFQPLVGSRVYELLFEPLDPFTVDAIQDEIINTITQHEKRVQLINVDVTPIYENNKINVSVEYQVIGVPIIEEITFVLQQLG
ncbi:baseplate wedge subunit [Cyanophage S-RIM50]|jgi:phage baseplate assembly protein W|uniref:Baseplate wedge subunit n=1 Tax=Cyanophage S-RIM50 TaxID=687803 RepID=A0A127KLB2_9CAUD|nr:baseplate wedge subunit [Cyanophage S-RIM50]AMO42874.1 baseplate wedge subunit [Cyanophage S-RIM50]